MKIRHDGFTWAHGTVATLLLTMACSALVHAEEESIVVDPATGDYIITYQGLDLEANSKWHRVVYVPATKINPEVKSKFRLNDKHSITYSYKIRNRSESKQAIRGFDMRANHADPATEITPKGWWAIITPGVDKMGQESGFIVGWSFETSDLYAGLVPGKSQGDFGFESSNLPGVSIAKLRGATEIIGFPDEGPGDDNPIYLQFRALLFNDFVSRPAAVPKIPVPTPFDAAVVLSGLQKHTKDDLVSMQLIEPAFVAQLDPWFASAIDAARRNNTEGLRHAIKELRRLLKQEHGDVDKDDDGDQDDNKEKKVKSRIDKLAAKVLDFDFKYVEQRVKGDKD